MNVTHTLRISRAAWALLAVVGLSNVNATLADQTQVVQQARRIPNFTDDGKVNGFKIFEIRPGSVFEQAGLQNGDVILRINGRKIDSAEKAAPLLQHAGTAGTVTFDLLRNGARKTATWKTK